MHRSGVMLVLFALLLLAGCSGDFDQREEIARTIGLGGGSTGTTANPNTGSFVRGVASIAGVVRNAAVVLRPVRDDGSVDWDDNNALGQGVTFFNGIYQVNVLNPAYRGPILVEIRGRSSIGVVSEGGNPATATSQKFHVMGPGHVMYSVLPYFQGASSGNTHVTPLTTFAVTRALAFDGSIAGVQGGIAAGLFGLTCQQTARFFGLGAVRASQPMDLAASGSFGFDMLHGYVLAALSQLARDIGVANVWDFWLGLALDGLDDGIANGSIGLVPNTGVTMPDLTQPNLIGSALLNGYLAPGNLDRVFGGDATQVVPGSALAQLINDLDASRNINNVTVDYDYIFRAPDVIDAARGATVRTSVLACQRIGTGTDFHPFGDSAGPSFVDFVWVSSSPSNVTVQPFGRIVVSPAAPAGDYLLTLTVQPKAGQIFVTGLTRSYTVVVKVR
jgi:hypothetical protein